MFDAAHWANVAKNMEAIKKKKEEAEKPVPPPTRKKGGKNGRPKAVSFGEKIIQCPCTLTTEDDRLFCNDWRSNRQSDDCLYLVHDQKCWLGLRK